MEANSVIADAAPVSYSVKSRLKADLFRGIELEKSRKAGIGRRNIEVNGVLEDSMVGGNPFEIGVVVEGYSSRHPRLP